MRQSEVVTGNKLSELTHPPVPIGKAPSRPARFSSIQPPSLWLGYITCQRANVYSRSNGSGSPSRLCHGMNG